MSSTESVLFTDGLNKSFGHIHAVKDVNLSVNGNEFTAIIGPNGAGKTTLLRLLTGEMQPTEGAVYYRGEDITALDQYEICKLGLGKSYQVPSVFSELTVLENVRLSIQRHENDRLSVFKSAADHTEDLEKARKILDELDLLGEVDTVADTLSHGDKRKLDIAITLATGAETILFDEPIAGMSQSETEKVIDLLDELSQTYSIVVVEHDINFVLSFADRIIVLEQGQVIADGSPDEIREDERVQKAYLGN
jgi:branched-chain amino acid transport system ATP-binding protein